MKKDICIETTQMSEIGIAESLNSLIDALKAPAEWLRQYYGHVAGREISMKQTLLLVNAQVALLAMASATAGGLLLQAASALWLGISVAACKRSLAQK